MGTLHLAILSKERPDKVLTAKILEHFSPIYLFVEPQEISLYKKFNRGLRIVKIPKSNMGLAYARNCVLDHFSNEPVLQMDDDVVSILKRDPKTKKLRRISGDPNEMDSMMKALNDGIDKGYGLVSISYAPSNWYETKSFKLNSRVWCIMGINSRYGVRFDERCLSCADYDFTAQMIYNGFKSVVFYDWAFDCVPMTTNTGGCQSCLLLNRKDRTLQTYKYLLSKWGPQIVVAKASKKLPLEIQFRWSRIGK